MSRGVISGILWGLLISFLLVAVVSLNGRLPGNEPPATGTAEVPAGSQFNGAREDGPAVLPGQAEVTTPPEAVNLAAPERDGLDTIDSAATEPGARPETGGPETTLVSAPPEAASSGAPEQGAGDTPPVKAAPADPVPAAPGAEMAPAPATRPAAAPARDVAELTAPEQPSAGAGDESQSFPARNLAAAADAPRPRAPAPESVVQVPAAAERGGLPAADTGGAVQPEAPEAPAVPAVEAAEGTPDVPAPDAPAPGTGQAGRAEAPAEETAPPAAPADPAAPEPEIDMAAAEPPLPVTEAEETSDLPGRRVGTLTERDGGTGGRLPSIGSAPAAAAREEAEAATVEAPADDAALPPVRRFAESFENPEDKPLMAIVLMDEGDSGVSPETLAEFPFPVTVALNPERAGAAEAMRAYRAAGLEVMMLAGMAAASDARDLETAFEVWRAALPEAVAVMETPALGLQGAKPVADHLGPLLSASGHGLVLYPNGFDTARKLAAKAGVPAATVFRDFDAEGQDEAVIRRFLDHAAFRARQSDGVIMTGRLRPETVQALALWGLQDRAGQVALAPISALLLAQEGDGAG
ncbi:divergent polysaccharide deacetylase family protein [Pseudooceanicola sp.]|uniref:divergent polysaccharide deacetylase family protein n=1 Tax=Pseudooceanicola sp. TaxID=1914328 RepID=UPI0040592D25